MLGGLPASNRKRVAMRPVHRCEAHNRANTPGEDRSTSKAPLIPSFSEGSMTDRYLQVRTIRRGTSAGVATYAAAYRAGETLIDARTGNLYKYAWRQDVNHAEITLPAHFKDDARLDWARNRSLLWNGVEHSERQKNSRVAREYAVVLPAQMTPSQRLSLVRSFAQVLADRHQIAVDFAIHEPRRPRSETFHAHLLATTREVTPEGLGRKIERPGRSYRQFMGRELRAIHGIWHQQLDRALRKAGLAVSQDRSPRPVTVESCDEWT
jgi:hypothetical protein